MALSEAQRRAKRKYLKAKRAQINIGVAKETKAEYKLAAAKLKIGLARLIRLGVEEYVRNHGETLPRELAENPLTGTEKILLKRFNSLPERAQQHFMKLMGDLAGQLGSQVDEDEAGVIE